MADILDRLDELHGKATPGEWLDFHGVALCECNGEDGRSFPNANSPDLEGNAALIVALHNAYPTLAARLRATEADNERLKSQLYESCREERHSPDRWLCPLAADYEADNVGLRARVEALEGRCGVLPRLAIPDSRSAMPSGTSSFVQSGILPAPLSPPPAEEEGR